MNFNSQSESIKLKTRTKKKREDNWTLSYGDMVTALLCFFIIFYIFEKQLEKTKIEKFRGLSTLEGNLKEHVSPQIDLDYKYVVEALDGLPDIRVEKSSSFVDILFKKTQFFKRGDFKLSPDGKVAINEVMERLKKLEKNYGLEIQGHSDSLVVKNQKGRWWQSNMELSVLRSLNVYKYLSDHYVIQNNLAVAGYGDEKNFEGEKSSSDANRRVTFRLQILK